MWELYKALESWTFGKQIINFKQLAFELWLSPIAYMVMKWQIVGLFYESYSSHI